MKHRKPVAQANGDVSPDLAVGQLKDTVGRQSRVAFGQGLKPPLQVGKGFVGEHPVDGSQGPLLDGQQLLCAGDGLGGDIVHQRHEQVQLRFFPEVLSLVGVGGVLDDDLRDGLYQVLVMLDLAEAVPRVAVLHVEEVEHPYLVAFLLQEGGHTLVNFALGIDQDHALLPAGGLEDEGLYKASGFS